jgi:hypothetical protein
MTTQTASRRIGFRLSRRETTSLWPWPSTLGTLAVILGCLLGSTLPLVAWSDSSDGITEDINWLGLEDPIGPVQNTARSLPPMASPVNRPLTPQNNPPQSGTSAPSGIPPQGISAEMPNRILSPAKPILTDAKGKRLGRWGRFKRQILPGKEPPPVSDEAVTQVGPRTPGTTQVYPLVALPMAIANVHGERLNPGFYGANLKVVAPNTYLLQLIRKNHSQLDIPVTLNGTIVEPIEPMNPSLPMPAKAVAMTSADQQSVWFEVRQGGKVFHSIVIPAWIP